MLRIIQVTLVLATSFAFAVAVACSGIEGTTPAEFATPKLAPTPTASSQGVAFSRLATITASSADGQRAINVILTAEREALSAKALLQAAPPDKRNMRVARATATRLIADAAIATATALVPAFVATEAADLATKTTAQKRQERQMGTQERRAENCGEALTIRVTMVALDQYYEKRGVSLGELSVFKPAEATARAEKLSRASELCP